MSFGHKHVKVKIVKNLHIVALNAEHTCITDFSLDPRRHRGRKNVVLHPKKGALLYATAQLLIVSKIQTGT